MKQSKTSYVICEIQFNIIYSLMFLSGARDDAVGWGIALEAGRSRVHWDFFIDVILQTALVALASTHPLSERSDRNICCEIKAAGAYGWQPYYLHVPIVLKSGGPTLLETSGFLQGLLQFFLFLSFAFPFSCFDQTYAFVISPVHAINALLRLWRDYSNKVLNSTS